MQFAQGHSQIGAGLTWGHCPLPCRHSPWTSRGRAHLELDFRGCTGTGSFWGPPAHGHPRSSLQEPLFVLLQYLPPGVISLVNFLGPLLFTFLVQLENYPPNTEVNLTLMW